MRLHSETSSLSNDPHAHVLKHNKMAKYTIFIILSICLTLQLATAFPSQNCMNEIEDNDISKIESTEITEPETESEFPKLIQPVFLNSLRLIEQQSTTLITETSNFVDKLLVELSLLPEQNALAQVLITTLPPLLERMKKLNLYDQSTPVLREKAEILMDISKMYRSFEELAKTDDSDNDILMVKRAFGKLEVKKLNERIDKSLQDAVRQFLTEFIPFWNALSDTDKEEHRNLSDWYTRFQATSTTQEQFKSLVDFMRILKSIILTGH